MKNKGSFKKAKILGDKKTQKLLMHRRYERHVRRLNKYVEYIRRRKVGSQVPYFDPNDGGASAKVLFLLEAPGRRAIASGFISRNNPDDTAKNMLNFLEEAGFKRKETILWNIVPWYIGDNQNIRHPNTKDIAMGLVYLKQLRQTKNSILSKLKAVVLVGRHAQKVESKLMDSSEFGGIRLFSTYHPSPMFVNRNKGVNKKAIIRAFRKVRKYLERA